MALPLKDYMLVKQVPNIGQEGSSVLIFKDSNENYYVLYEEQVLLRPLKQGKSRPMI